MLIRSTRVHISPSITIRASRTFTIGHVFDLMKLYLIFWQGIYCTETQGFQWAELDATHA